MYRAKSINLIMFIINRTVRLTSRNYFSDKSKGGESGVEEKEKEKLEGEDPIH